MPVPIPPAVLAFLDAARVGHLATADRAGRPLVLPICFAAWDGRLALALDEKPKRRAPRDLERVRNLRENPQAAVVVDRWDEDWTRLSWVHLRGRARLVEPSAGAQSADPPGAPSDALHRDAIARLRAKYAQYRGMALETRPVIVLEVEHVRSWGRLD